MAHFAKLDNSNKVIQIIKLENADILDADGIESEAIGISICRESDDETWLQTSYNTYGGVHIDQGTRLSDGGVSIRKNYAGIGDTYDSTRDAFISPQPYASWILDENTCRWEALVPYPEVLEGSDEQYKWDEESINWVLVALEEE